MPASECGQLEAHSNFPTHRVYLVSVIGKPLLPPSILYDKDHFRLSVLVHTVFISQYLISFLKNSYKNYSVFFLKGLMHVCVYERERGSVVGRERGGRKGRRGKVGGGRE